jgi:hypothetical protein
LEASAADTDTISLCPARSEDKVQETTFGIDDDRSGRLLAGKVYNLRTILRFDLEIFLLGDRILLARIVF